MVILTAMLRVPAGSAAVALRRRSMVWFDLVFVLGVAQVVGAQEARRPLIGLPGLAEAAVALRLQPASGEEAEHGASFVRAG